MKSFSYTEYIANYINVVVGTRNPIIKKIAIITKIVKANGMNDIDESFYMNLTPTP